MTEQKLHYEHIGGKSLEVMSVCPHCKNTKVPISARCKRSKSSIAQAIRDAAVNWPQFLGDVESEIVLSFCGAWAKHSDITLRDYLLGTYGENGLTQARTFLLLVSEALES